MIKLKNIISGINENYKRVEPNSKEYDYVLEKSVAGFFVLKPAEELLRNLKRNKIDADIYITSTEGIRGGSYYFVSTKYKKDLAQALRINNVPTSKIPNWMLDWKKKKIK